MSMDFTTGTEFNNFGIHLPKETQVVWVSDLFVEEVSLGLREVTIQSNTALTMSWSMNQFGECHTRP